MFRPEIDLNRCTACGFCIKYCPTEAISIVFDKKEEINV
jgi:formate hydrogenlyase subunit 6/NADH:ubiquinone oxidoreductase subunit I